VGTIIEAFRELHDEPRIHLLIAGEGATLDHCRRLAAEVAPERIHFESPWLDTIAVLHAADAVVLPTRAAQSTASVPSKLISYLLAARPIVAAALPDSDTADMVHASGAGVVVAPDDPRALAAAILAMAASPAEERRRMGGAGRAWALANVTRDVCLPRIVGIIESEAR
jgi:glycosyltransferase involved in cell wall biosynthesis